MLAQAKHDRTPTSRCHVQPARPMHTHIRTSREPNGPPKSIGISPAPPISTRSTKRLHLAGILDTHAKPPSSRRGTRGMRTLAHVNQAPRLCGRHLQARGEPVLQHRLAFGAPPKTESALAAPGPARKAPETVQILTQCSRAARRANHTRQMLAGALLESCLCVQQGEVRVDGGLHMRKSSTTFCTWPAFTRRRQVNVMTWPVWIHNDL